MIKQDYESMTLSKLKEIAKELEIKNISKYKKNELIEEIISVSPNSIKKDGVILRENISPKAVEKIQRSDLEMKNSSSNSENSKIHTGEDKRETSNIKDRNFEKNVKRDYSENQNVNNNRNDDSQNEKKEVLREMINESNSAKGILEILENNNFGFLRCKNYLTSSEDIYVSPSQIRRFNLRTGDEVEGKIREAKESEKFKALLFVQKVNGEAPEKAIGRKSFETLTPIYPTERLKLETQNSGDLSSRLMDIICPLGKGQRGVIVAPPKAGKTTLLKKVAQNIVKNYPDIKLIVLLIDERPEEVTDIKENVEGATVFASTFDDDPKNHIKVTEEIIEKAKMKVEDGKHVVILLDSLTRLSRAYNIVIPSSGKLLSGGIDPMALYHPKNFFGAARNIKNGGSLTIIATILVDTGSKMDEVIYEEFKSTGNCDIYLDKQLAEFRVFPAIDITKSGTRKEELLLNKNQIDDIWNLRRLLNDYDNKVSATSALIKAIKTTRNNDELLAHLPKVLYK